MTMAFIAEFCRSARKIPLWHCHVPAYVGNNRTLASENRHPTLSPLRQSLEHCPVGFEVPLQSCAEGRVRDVVGRRLVVVGRSRYE